MAKEILFNIDARDQLKKGPKVAFPFGEGGFPGKCLHCSGKDGRGPCR